MITRPLDLASRLSPPPRDLDFLSWVTVGLIALAFGLLGSRFIVPQGLPVDTNAAIVLPQADDRAKLPDTAGAPSVVVSYRRDNVILFQGGVYTLAELRKQVEGYAKDHPGAVMLVHFDRQVTAQAFVDLCEMARDVGFAHVVLAWEPKGTASK